MTAEHHGSEEVHGGGASGPDPAGLDLSVVIPCYNEEESIGRCIEETLGVLDREGLAGEILVVDDGSTDRSFDIVATWAERDPRVKALRLRRNFGQTAAMAAGIDRASGRVVVPMDADLQNDPASIPALLAKLEEGYDVVSGWRKARRDAALTRRLPSMAANWLISRISGVRLHDFGCTLKAYRRSVLEDVHLYGELHRFIPILASWTGARVTEIEVNHRPRVAGRSKYGLARTPKVLVDLITLKFLGDYSTRPAHFFGLVGLVFCLAGLLSAGVALWQKLFQGVWAHKNPLVLLAVFLFTVGVQMILIGLLAELIIRTYHESQGKPIYLVKETRNLPARDLVGGDGTGGR